MKIKSLVTGGCGFIGSHVVDLLIEKGHEVTVLDNLSTSTREFENPKADYHECDIRNYDQIRPHFNGIDYVFHLAALPRVEPSITNPLPSNDINTTGSLNVFFASKEANVKKIINTSSSSVYGDVPARPINEFQPLNPISPYGMQKLFGEQYLDLFHTLYGLNSISLRYFNVYGERQPTIGAYVPVVGIWFRQVEKGEIPTITGDGNNRRDFVNVKDVARANLLSINYKLNGHSAFNIGSGVNYSLNELCHQIHPSPKYIEARSEPRFTIADCSKAKKLLNWSSEINLIEWIKHHKPVS